MIAEIAANAEIVDFNHGDHAAIKALVAKYDVEILE